MKLARAVVGGGIGALLTVLLLALAQRMSGAATDVSTVIGALVFSSGGGVAWCVGAATQLVIGAVAGVLYAAAFEWVFRHAGAVVGLLVAIPHAVVAGLAIGFAPVWLRAAPDALPGAFLAFAGPAAAACFIAAHLVFGAFVGVWYGETIHRTATPAVTWHDVPSPGAGQGTA